MFCLIFVKMKDLSIKSLCFFYFFILVLKVKADVTIVSFYLKDIQKTTLSTYYKYVPQRHGYD